MLCHDLLPKPRPRFLSTLTALGWVLFLAVVARAEVTPLTGEFFLSSDDTQVRQDPTLALAPTGEVRAWWGLDFAPIGSFDIRERLWSSGPVATLNAVQPQQGPQARAAYSTSGRYVVVWRAGTASSEEIVGQVYSSDGTPTGSTFDVSVSPSNNEFPDVSWEPGGTAFKVVWQGGNKKQINVRRFDEDGVALSNVETLESVGGFAVVEVPAISHFPSGDAVVVWNQGGFQNPIDVEMVTLDASLNILTGPSNVGTTLNPLARPGLSHHTDGSFVVAWEYNVGGADWDVWARMYDSAAAALGPAFSVNANTDQQSHPYVDHASDGSFVITYMSDQHTISGQCFDAAGNPAGAEFDVSETVLLNLTSPDMLIDANDRLHVTWVGAGRIRAREYQVVVGATAVDPWIPEQARTFATPSVFRYRTQIQFEQAREGDARVFLYDVGGRLVRVLSAGRLGRGLQGISWDGRDERGRMAVAGVYLYRVEAAGVPSTGRVVKVQ